MIPQLCLTTSVTEGDCWRACVASILEMPVAEVPNFAKIGTSWEGMLAAAREWLLPRGFSIFETYCSAEWEIDKLLEVFSARNPSAPFILCGRSGPDPRDNHAVVLMDGRIAHDPSGCGLDGPCVNAEGERAWWWMHVITVAHPASAAPEVVLP